MAKTTKTKKTGSKPDAPAASKEAARAVARYLRISPLKIRLVIDAIRKKPVHQASETLILMNRKGARLASKLLNSALANAKNIGMDEGKLYVSDVRADGGPTLKRFQPRSMGRADRILKRTTHLSIELKESDQAWRANKRIIAQQAAEDTPAAEKPKASRKKKKAKAGA